MLGAPNLQDWQVPCCSFSTSDPEDAIRRQVQEGHYTDPRQAKNLRMKHFVESELCLMCATPTPSTGPQIYLPIYLMHVYLSTKTNADYSRPSSLTENLVPALRDFKGCIKLLAIG